MRALLFVLGCAACNPLFGEDYVFRDAPVAVGGGGSGGSGGAPAWVDAGHPHRKLLVLRSPPIADAVDAFVVPVVLNDADIAASAKPDGSDILFTRDDALSTMPHEIERYEGGALVAWVRLSSVAPGDTAFYIYYGATSADVYEDAASTWADVATSVWHLGDGDQGSYGDSAGDNDGALPAGAGAPTAGQGIAGGGVQLDGVDDLIDFGDPADESLDFALASFSLSVWVNVEMTPSAQRVFGKGGATNSNGYGFDVGAADSVVLLREGVSTVTAVLAPSSTLFGEWHHWVAVVDREGFALRAFLDGVAASATNITGLGSLSTPASLQIGGATAPLKGFVDEARIYPRVLDADWIALSHHTLQAGSALLEVGPEEDRP